MKQFLLFFSLLLCLFVKAQPGGGIYPSFIEVVDTTVHIKPQDFNITHHLRESDTLPMFPFFNANTKPLFNNDTAMVRYPSDTYEYTYHYTNRLYHLYGKNTLGFKPDRVFSISYMVCNLFSKENEIYVIEDVYDLQVIYDKKSFEISYFIAKVKDEHGGMIKYVVEQKPGKFVPYVTTIFKKQK